MRGSVTLLSLALGMALGVVGTRQFLVSDAPRNPARRAVESGPAKADAATIGRVEAIGYVEPLSEVRQLTFKTGGLIQLCRVKIGDRVAKGEILMMLDDGSEAAALDVAKEDLRVAQADEARILRGVNEHRIDGAKFKAESVRKRVAFLKPEYERYSRLQKEKTATLSEFQKIKSDLDSAGAELAALEAEVAHLSDFVLAEEKLLAAARVGLAAAKVRQQEHDLRDTRLLAPMDGTVLEILKREGESVSASLREPVLVFADLSAYRVRAEVDERYVHQVKTGQRATIYGRNVGDRAYHGTVILVKQLMGDKTVFAHSAAERKDLDAGQVFIGMEAAFGAPAGLRVDVAIDTEGLADEKLADACP